MRESDLSDLGEAIVDIDEKKKSPEEEEEEAGGDLDAFADENFRM